MSRQPDVVLSDSEEVTVEVQVAHWKDPRAYNAVLQRCQARHAKGKAVLLQNKAKALNHWAGDRSGVRDVTATKRIRFPGWWLTHAKRSKASYKLERPRRNNGASKWRRTRREKVTEIRSPEQRWHRAARCRWQALAKVV